MSSIAARQAGRRTAGTMLVLACILVAMVAFNIWLRTSMRQSVIDNEQRSVQRIVRSYSQHFEQTFVSIDSTLRAIAARVVIGEDSSRELHQVLKQTADALRVVRAFGITDSSGRLMYSSRAEPPPKVDMASRDYIGYFIAGGTDVRFISDPSKNLVDGDWQLAMAVPARSKTGELIAVVSAVIDPLSILNPMSNALGEGDDLTILTPELKVAATLPWDDPAIGKPLAATDSFFSTPFSRNVRGVEEAAGVFEDEATGDRRVNVSRRLFDGRFVLTSTRDLDTALATWFLLENIGLAVSVLLFGLIVCLVMLADRRLRLEMSQRSELAELNTRLKAESAEVERLANVKSDFLANMSHEIRTPMNAILGLTQLLKRTRLTPEQDNHLKRITASGRFLLSVIDDILTFTKIESDALEIEQTPFKLEDILGSLATMMSGSAAGKNLEVLIHLDPDVPQMLVGDPLRLQQVLFNLAGNAIKFTESGHVTVRVSQAPDSVPVTTQLPDQRVTLRFTVTDSGLGIPRDKLPLLFSPFSQADTSTTRRFGGTGLGLAICKRLTGLMGGTIGVDSEVGHGSSFWFTVPFRTARKDASVRMPANMRHLSVLVVDDNTAARDAICTAVQALNWNCDEAESGALALSRLRSRALNGRSPDVVLVDFDMPGMDGVNMAELLRSEAFLGQPMLVLVTNGQSENMPDDVIDSVLIKPVTSSTLFDAVQQARAHRDGTDDLHGLAGEPSDLELKGIRILLVEDNSINQDIARHLLQHEGAQVTVADHGRMAVEKLTESPEDFDVVLMDVQMPVMDGIEASLEIRNRLGLKGLPIVAQTAGALAPDRDRCRAAGMNGFISKPFDADKLPQQILAHVRNRPDGSAPVSQARRAGQPANAAPPQVVTAGSAHAPITTIEGIDVTEALRLLGGSDTLLRSLLSLLASQFGRIDVEVRELLAAGNVGKAQSALHRLRGGAAQVGARGLHDAAVRLEQALALDDDGSGSRQAVLMHTEQLEQLSREVARVMPAVRKALATR